jgi:glycosyltransferase involved in cell wall biosynthesis
VTSAYVVLAEGDRRRWGGDLRRHYLLRGLAHETGAAILEDWRPARLERALRPMLGRRWEIWRRRPLIASAELLDEAQLEPVLQYGRLLLVDIHDDPVLQSEALGVTLPPSVVTELARQGLRNRNAFRWLVAPSRPFADLAGLDPERTIIASNGSATDVVRPAPWPDAPAVAFASGAAPRRGIEELVAAARIVRSTVPDVRLDLWLAATGDESRSYLSRLTADLATDPWISIGQAPYERFGTALGRATVLAIPTPAHPYWDSVAPIKLFDKLAVGRPIVTTPRIETARIVRTAEAGIVTVDDSAEAMASALVAVLTNQANARRMGANARALVEREYDWKVIGRHLADDVLDRMSVGRRFRSLLPIG